jgi:hypothetical protein
MSSQPGTIPGLAANRYLTEFFPSNQIVGHHHHTMKCWHCENEAKAICVFCGRGVCATHRQAKAHFAGYGLKKRPILAGIFHFASPTATCVRDASWCGVCQVEDVETY